MSTRPRFEMRRFLTAWNIMLAAFSIFGFARTLPEFLHVLFSIPRGMYHSVCSSRYKGFFSLLWNMFFNSNKVKWPTLGLLMFSVITATLKWIGFQVSGRHCLCCLKFQNWETLFSLFWGNNSWNFCIGKYQYILDRKYLHMIGYSLK